MKICPSGLLKLIRISFASFLILVSLWALLLPPSFPYSSHAVVNAHAIPIRSADRGTIRFDVAPRSDVLKKGERLASISRDMEKVQRELKERKLEESKLSGQISHLEGAIKTHRERLSDARRKLEEERFAALENLKGAKNVAEDRLKIFQLALEERSNDERRVEPLFREGIVTAAQWSEVRQGRISAARDLTSVETELSEIEGRINTHLNGFELRTDSSNAGLLTIVETAENEIGTLDIKRSELQSELEELQQQIALADASSRLDEAYNLTTPIDGPVWHRRAVDGESVMEDQVVAEVVDEDSLYIEAYFRRDFLTRIAIGDCASVYLVGETRFLEGTVTDIQVQESIARENRAVNIVETDNYMLTVTIEVDQKEVELEDIGQFVKVLVSSRGRSGWMERSQIWLSLILRSHRDP